jgi:4-diphosphocytidyl-2-C-methyl-D-erythritol kinase
MTNDEIRISAPAKVNLILQVLDRRPDGYHNLWSLMQTVALEDQVSVRLCPDSTELRLFCDDPALPTDGQNLVTRAAALVLNEAHRQSQHRVGVEIHLAKRIPAGGGLGGGSSDAAATIVGLNRLLGLGWSAEEMARVGQSLGSDVPFFFFAPSAVIRGRGEEVVPVVLTGERWVVLVNPGFPIETRWAYERLAGARRGVRQLSEGLRRLDGKAALSWDEVIPLMENDFEEALTPVHQMIGTIKAELVSLGAEAALLSGSGATVFGIFRDENSARRARETVSLTEGRRAFAVRAGTVSSMVTRQGSIVQIA